MNWEIDDKRMQFRSKLRSKHVDNILNSMRQRFIQEQKSNPCYSPSSYIQKSSDPHVDNPQLNSEFADANKYTSPSTRKTAPDKSSLIEGMLKEVNRSWERQHQDQNRKHLRSEVVKRIWSIVLKSCNQACLSQESMKMLIKSSKEDIKTLSNPADRSEKTQSISQRVSRIMWILLNECGRSAEISVEIAKQITQLCVSILIQYQKIKKSSSQSQDQTLLPDPTLCIILLGNICVNEQHVKSILGYIKLSRLIAIVEEISDQKQYENLLFVLCNILFYYPEHCLEEEGQHRLGSMTMEDSCSGTSEDYELMLLRIKQEQLELLQILWALYTKLSQDMLLTARTSIKKSSSRYETPNKSSTKQKLAPTSQTKKKLRNDYALLSVQQKQKIESLMANQYNGIKISNNYSHDLMECISKVKRILLALGEQEARVRGKLKGRIKGKRNGTGIEEVGEACRKLGDEIGSKEKYTVVLIIRILYYQSEQKNKKNGTYSFDFHNDREKISYMVLFLRDIFRCFQPSPTSTNKQLQQYIMSCKSEQLLKLINKQILTPTEQTVQIYATSSQQLEYEQQQLPNPDILDSKMQDKYQVNNIEDDIVDSLWEIYGYVVKYLVRNRSSWNLNQVGYGGLWGREMEGLEDRLVAIHGRMKGEDRMCAQQAKGLNLLAQYSQIATTTHLSSTHNRQPSQQPSQQSCVHLEIDMKQIQNLLNFLKHKLTEHLDNPVMIYSILRAIQTVVKRVKHYMSGLDDEDSNCRIRTRLVRNRDLLGKDLYNMLYQGLQKFGEETAIGLQICELRSELLNQELQIQEQEKMEEQA